jgi:anaerobic magnesium-protoporphyrin IX monomethyl ester cyclase
MKIMFIYSLEDVQSLLIPLWSWSTIQLGISYISSLLKSESYQTRLVVLGSNNRWPDNLKLLKTQIGDFDPQLICLTSVASQYPFIRKIATTLKNQWPDKYLIIGGAHATLNPADVIKDPCDAVCVGEGEYPILELCRQLETNTAPHGIANLWIKSPDGSIESNSARPFLQDLDSLPFPDRNMWSPWIKTQPDTELSILVGRGCPYECTYCCNHVLKKVAPGNYVRFRSPENIIREISDIHATHPAQSTIYFEVESIAINKDWLLELCSQLETFNATIGNFISYRANFRISPQSKDENIFWALKKANFYKINIGLESGNERIRREILNRNYSNEDFLEVASKVRKVGLQFSVFNMIGIPGETYADYLETVLINRQCQPDAHSTGIFFPYPGTKIYDLCLQKGYIKNLSNYHLERSQAVIDYPHFSRRQIQKAFTWFNYRVYRGSKPLWWLLIRTLMVEIRSHVTLNYLFHRLTHWPVYNYLRKKLTRI